MQIRSYIDRFGPNLILFCQKYLAATFIDKTVPPCQICFCPAAVFQYSLIFWVELDKGWKDWWIVITLSMQMLQPLVELCQWENIALESHCRKGLCVGQRRDFPHPLSCPPPAGQTGLILMSLVTQMPFHMS